MSVRYKEVFLVLLIVSLPIATAIDYKGCTSNGAYTHGNDQYQTFHAKKGADVTLSSDAANCHWEQNGKTISGSGKLTFSADKDTEYVLVCAGSGKTTSRLFATIVVSVSSCLPEKGSEIKIDGKKYSKDDTRETATGEELDFSVSVKGGCKNYQVEWSVDPSSAIVFAKPGSLSTKGYVANDYSGKNPTVTVTFTSEDGSKQREQTTKLAISDNFAPSIKIRTDSSIQSYTSFSVSFEGSTSGKSDDENDYIAEIEAWLKDAEGTQVNYKSKSVSKGQSLPTLSLKPRAMGAYTLTARITDSYGAIAEKTTTILVTEKGNTGKDKAMIEITEHINCTANQLCKIPVERSNRNISVRYYEKDDDGELSSLLSPFNFSEGIHEVQVYAYYFNWKTKKEQGGVWKTVWVHAVANNSNAFNDANASVSVAELVNDTPIAREEPDEAQETLIPHESLVALPIAAFLARRRRKNLKG